MLYVTTRNKRDAVTAPKTLQENRSVDGGLYLPFQTPRFSTGQIASLKDKPFGQNVADVLNLLFGTKLSSWDVDFCIGRFPVRTENLRHRILITETWHNPQWNYDWLVQKLVQRISPAASTGNWVTIAVRIALLFGVFGDLLKSGVSSADICVVSGDFSAPISAWYARQWGLPIRNIVCCCNENNSLWDLVCHGQFRTDAISIPTLIPEADVTVPENLERLIDVCGGTDEVQAYLDACRCGGTYYPSDSVLAKIREGLFVSVVSSSRIDSTICGVYGTSRYLMSPHTALAYAGLLDYRAKKGETGYTVILSEKSPMESCVSIAKALDMPEEGIRRIL